MGGESDHTRLDLDVIKEMGTGLSNVKKAFDGLEKLSGKYKDDFGNGDLADKFGDFADNWEISREKLTGEIDALAQIAKAAAKAYEDIDHQLAEAIRGAQDPKMKGK
uniref:WXG100 family type VII secretion target n=1 Tax=Streptomyces sp. NBC_01393 TaxID=2903851 RepID=A0AAU3I3J3_9ACTN